MLTLLSSPQKWCSFCYIQFIVDDLGAVLWGWNMTQIVLYMNECISGLSRMFSASFVWESNLKTENILCNY